MMRKMVELHELEDIRQGVPNALIGLKQARFSTYPKLSDFRIGVFHTRCPKPFDWPNWWVSVKASEPHQHPESERVD